MLGALFQELEVETNICIFYYFISVNIRNPISRLTHSYPYLVPCIHVSPTFHYQQDSFSTSSLNFPFVFRSNISIIFFSRRYFSCSTLQVVAVFFPSNSQVAFDLEVREKVSLVLTANFRLLSVPSL